MATKRFPHIDSFSWQLPVITAQSSPPAATKGDRYLVTATATGDWTGKENDIAEHDGEAWFFITPVKGFAVINKASMVLLGFDGNGWVSIGGDAVQSNLDTHVDDKTNPHEVTKTQVELGNVDNVQQAAKTDFDTHVADKTNPHDVTAVQAGADPVGTAEGEVNDALDEVVNYVPTYNVGIGYTPILTSVTNTSALSVRAFRYTRVGNVVTVQGQFSVTATSANAVTGVRISLPIARNIAAAADLSGVATIARDGLLPNPIGEPAVGFLYGSSTDDEAIIRFYSTSATGEDHIVFITFSYNLVDGTFVLRDYVVLVEDDGGVVLKPTWVNALVIEAINLGFFDDIAFWTNVEKFGAKYLDEILTYFTFVSSVDGIVIDEDYTRVEIAAAVHGGYFDDIDLWTSIKFGVEE